KVGSSVDINPIYCPVSMFKIGYVNAIVSLPSVFSKPLENPGNNEFFVCFTQFLLEKFRLTNLFGILAVTMLYLFSTKNLSIGIIALNPEKVFFNIFKVLLLSFVVVVEPFV